MTNNLDQSRDAPVYGVVDRIEVGGRHGEADRHGKVNERAERDHRQRRGLYAQVSGVAVQRGIHAKA